MDKREPSYTVGGNVSGATTVENSVEVPQKTKNRTNIRSRNPTLGHISRENGNLKRYMRSSVHCSTVYNSQDIEAT